MNPHEYTAGLEQILGSAQGAFVVTGEASTSDLEWAAHTGRTVQRHPVTPMPYLPASARAAGALRFGLSFFANDEDAVSGPKYRLLLEAARLADAEGLHAIWFPERHFHSFGGLYPSPATIGAALATATARIGLRAGSVVMPLHDPIRVAEEWSVIDNLSGGRAGVSFASGWHADDFVLAPDNYAGRRDLMTEGIDTVRRLWRGEPVERRNGAGDTVKVTIRPRPVQPELPFWLTAAGSPETFRAAGRAGAGVLTNLMGQTLEDLASKVDLYRREHPGTGHVTLMLHSFLADTEDAAYTQARDPLLSYFRSSVDITRGFLAAQGLGIRPEDLTPADIQSLLEHGVERYLREGGGLFGTVESCAAMLPKLHAAGVDEVAALIDFGMPLEATLHSVRLLARLAEGERARAEAARDSRVATIRTQLRALADWASRHPVAAIQAGPDTLEWMLEHTPDLVAGRAVLTEAGPGREAVLRRAAAAGAYPLIDEGKLAAKAVCGAGGERWIRPARPVTVLDGLGRPLGVGIVGTLSADATQRARWRGDGMLELLAAPAPRTAPLSYAQQRLWTIDKLPGTAIAYNNPVALRMHGTLDPGALAEALHAVIRRHEALRTAFPATDDGPVQVILPAAPIELPVADADPSDVPRLSRDFARLPFDLATGPLLHARLLRLSDVEHVLLICMHHIISDGWTAGVLFTELAAVYAARLEHQPPALPRLSAQYADYAIWQRGLDFSRELGYWREHLAGAPTLELPLDRPRGPLQKHDGARHPVRLDRDLIQALRALCGRSGVTLFMALQAALVTLLHRYSGQTDIVTGTAVAGRSRPEFEGLVGVFVNSVVMRIDASGDPGFAELLQRVKDTALSAFAHADVPFERLVDELKVTRALSLTPLFQAMLVLHNTPRPQLKLGPLMLEMLDTDAGISKLDLLLDLREEEGEVVGAWEYNTSLFDAATIDAFNRHLAALLASACADPSQPLSRLSMLSPAEHETLLELSQGPSLHPPFATVGAAFSAQAALTPQALAVGDTLTYAALDALSDRIAATLHKHGCGPGERVALLLQRPEETIAAMLGALKAGAAYVPIDPHAPPNRIESLLRQATPALVLSTLDSLEEDGDFQPGVRGEDTAYVIFTSGSTGEPKGVMVSHAQLLASTFARVEYYGGPAGRCVAPYPLTFDASVGWIYYTLLTGGTLWLGDGPDPRALAALIRRVGADRFSSVPALYARLLEAAGPGELSSLRTVSVIGERCPPEVFRAHLDTLPETGFHNEYGPTEATVWCTSQPVTEVATGEVPIGRPIPGAAAYVLDRSGGLAPVNASGELHVGGLGVALGYLGRPELTSEKFVPNPFGPGKLYRTGDLARWNRQGTLEFLGRIDRQVKVRGFRVEPAEVETAMAEHPALSETAVVAVTEPGTTRLIGYAAMRSGLSATPADILGFLRTRLPDYLIPAQIVVLAALPRTPNGKLDVAALPAPQGVPAEFAEPSTETERVLAEIFSSLVGGERIGVNDDFFAAGGDSLLAITAVTRARKAGVDLDVQQIFQYPTVAGLARVASTSDGKTADRAPLTGPLPLGPNQKRFFSFGFEHPVPWNGAIHLELTEAFDPGTLEAAFRTVLRHHDALRTRFTNDGNGWQAHYGDPDEPWELWHLSPERPDELDRLQASLDLTHGPLIRAALVHGGPGRPGRLVIAAHHLIIDGYSWRIVLEDLLTAYRGLELAPKSSSYRQWAEGMAAFAHSERAAQQLGYWTSLPYDRPSAVPRDGDAANLEGSLTVLRTKAPAIAGDVHSALVTALATVVAEWTSNGYVRLDLQRHGRQDLVPGADLSRTVGWFSPIHPFVAHLPSGVDDALRAVPDGGAGFTALRFGLPGSPLLDLPRAEVFLNYQGRLDAVMPQGVPARLCAEPAGRIRHPSTPRAYLINVMAGLGADGLWLDWHYNEGIHSRATITRLAGHLTHLLR